jgi:hypothetical protein
VIGQLIDRYHAKRVWTPGREVAAGQGATGRPGQAEGLTSIRSEQAPQQATSLQHCSATTPVPFVDRGRSHACQHHAGVAPPAAGMLLDHRRPSRCDINQRRPAAGIAAAVITAGGWLDRMTCASRLSGRYAGWLLRDCRASRAVAMSDIDQRVSAGSTSRSTTRPDRSIARPRSECVNGSQRCLRSCAELVAHRVIRNLGCIRRADPVRHEFCVGLNRREAQIKAVRRDNGSGDGYDRGIDAALRMEIVTANVKTGDNPLDRRC